VSRVIIFDWKANIAFLEDWDNAVAYDCRVPNKTLPCINYMQGYVAWIFIRLIFLFKLLCTLFSLCCDGLLHRCSILQGRISRTDESEIWSEHWKTDGLWTWWGLKWQTCGE